MAELDRACCDYPDAVTGIVTAEKLAELANKNQHESTLRNAILVESIQGLPDIKMMQAESRFLQQWNSYVAITAESGVQTRKVTHGLVSWGMSIQNLLYATVVAVGAPLVINGDITTGAMVAASMLSSRMVAPMAALCGVLARWQQVKVAKASLDNLMALPVEGGWMSRGSIERFCTVIMNFATPSFVTAKTMAPHRCELNSFLSKPGKK